MKSPRAKRCVTTARRRPGGRRAAGAGRRGIGVNQAGRDRDVPGPLVFQVQGGGLAVHADVGNAPSGPRQGDGQLEGGRRPDGLDGHVGARPSVREGSLRPLLEGSVHGDVRAELLGRLQAGVRPGRWRRYGRLNRRAPVIADRPMGPVPTTATTSPGRTAPLRTPTSYPVGRMSASMRISSSVTPSGTRYVTGRRRARGRTRPASRRSCGPGSSRRRRGTARTVPRGRTGSPAGGDARDQHAVARWSVRTPAHGFDRADGLMARIRPSVTAGHHP